MQHQGQQKALKHCSTPKTDFNHILHADLARFQGGFDQVCTTEHNIVFVIFNMGEERVAQENKKSKSQILLLTPQFPAVHHTGPLLLFVPPGTLWSLTSVFIFDTYLFPEDGISRFSLVSQTPGAINPHRRSLSQRPHTNTHKLSPGVT